jgi:hypothetical protein
MRRSLNKMPGDWLFKVVPVFIAVVFVAIASFWIFLGYLVVTTTPADVARGIGQIVRSAEQGYNDGDSLQDKPASPSNS